MVEDRKTSERGWKEKKMMKGMGRGFGRDGKGELGNVISVQL